MKIIIPMAGTGQRFIDAGYSVPKPFIIVGGKMLVEHIVDMFDKENDEFIFIISESAFERNDAPSLRGDYAYLLMKLVKQKVICVAPDNNHGPVWSFLNAKLAWNTGQSILQMFGDDEEVIVSYCDNPFLWDYDLFKRRMEYFKPDGAILSHRGFHPHRLSSTYMAYMKLNAGFDVLEIKEKEPYTEDPMDEHASTGTYYFRKGSYIKKYFQELVGKKLCHSNGEYYVTLVYNLMIADGLKVLAYPTSHVTVFGTPAELENYNAWQTILKGDQVRNETDLLSCYRYWKSYNKDAK